MKNTRIERKGKKEIQGRNDHARLIRDVVIYVYREWIGFQIDTGMNIKVGGLKRCRYFIPLRLKIEREILDTLDNRS